MVEVLLYIYKNNGSHRDIKPNNILIYGDDPENHETLDLKLTDFGCGKMAQDSMQYG